MAVGFRGREMSYAMSKIEDQEEVRNPNLTSYPDREAGMGSRAQNCHTG